MWVMEPRWHGHCPCIWLAACTSNLAPKLRESADAPSRDKQSSWYCTPVPHCQDLSHACHNLGVARMVWLWPHKKASGVTGVAMQAKFRPYFCNDLGRLDPQWHRCCNYLEGRATHLKPRIMHLLVCIIINLSLRMQCGAPDIIFYKTAHYRYGYLAASRH